MARVRDDERTGVPNPASEGVGPLLQRDYWAVLKDCALRPSELATLLAERFCEFPPEELVEFTRTAPGNAPLQVGDDLAIDIRGAGSCAVRVIHRDSNSITLLTGNRHPEAGRITFGAYRNDDGDVIFHIRSRARASSAVRYAEYVALGEAMQTNTWADFINRLATAVCGGVRGEIQSDTVEVEPDETDGPGVAQPTFLARGD